LSRLQKPKNHKPQRHGENHKKDFLISNELQLFQTQTMLVIVPPGKSPLMRARRPRSPVFRAQAPMERGRPARNASRRLAYRRIFHHRGGLAVITLHGARLLNLVSNLIKKDFVFLCVSVSLWLMVFRLNGNG
jgi:hypothetical protein